MGHAQRIPEAVAAAQYPAVVFNTIDVVSGRLASSSDSSPAIEVPPPPLTDEESGAAISSIASQMRALIQETLASGTVKGWEEAFFNNVRTYETFSRALGELVRRLQIPAAVRKRNREKVERALLQRFPAATGEIRFITSVVEDAAEHATTFASRPVPDNLRAEDHECASRFSAFGSVFNMCLSTLYFIAKVAPSTSDEIAEAALELARHAALEFNDATMDAEQLREASEQSGEQPAEPIERAHPDDDDLEHVEELIQRTEKAGAGQARA